MAAAMRSVAATARRTGLGRPRGRTRMATAAARNIQTAMRRTRRLRLASAGRRGSVRRGADKAGEGRRRIRSRGWLGDGGVRWRRP